MVPLKIPIKAKVYEALGALADGRVHILSDNEAQVLSSTTGKSYRIQWSADRRSFRSNDNASRWQGTIGYPIIAVLLKLQEISYDPTAAAPLSGVRWKELNDLAKRNYDKVVEDVLAAIAARGGDVDHIRSEVDRIHSTLERLQIQKL